MTLFDAISSRKLRQLAENASDDAPISMLAKTLVGILDARGEEDAEARFCELMQDYFYNMSATAKRRYADALAVALCEQKSDFDNFWGYLKSAGVTGRTRT